MAPVKISYVVSFSSQDPKYPAENLLSEDTVRPWLGCPQDRSRQLSVELQLERASPIGYVDIGNYGCAFLQIEVGRSSWPRDQPYLTLVPTVTLMTPDDSKLDQNRCGVRMFKEADFPVLAVGQKWDRLRLTCSQPFSPRSRFGLSFIRLRTPQEQEPEPPQPLPGLDDTTPSDSPWCSSPDFHQTSFSKPCSRSREEQLRSRLCQLQGGVWSPAYLSRPAQMVLLAAQSRALRPRAGTSTPSGGPELPVKDLGGPVVPGSALDIPAAPSSPCRQPDRHRARSSAARASAAASRVPRVRGRAKAHGPQERQARRSDRGQTSSDNKTGVCPICSDRFLLDVLPMHASLCGEEEPMAAWSSLFPDTWVSCPICQMPFSTAEVEQHASTCGDTQSSAQCPQ